MRIALIGQVSNVHVLRSLCERCAALDVDQLFYVGGQSEISELVPEERARADEENSEDVWTLASHCATASVETIRAVADRVRRRNALLGLVDFGDAPSLQFRSPSNLRFALCTAFDAASEPSIPSGTDEAREPDSARANVVVTGDAATWLVEERAGAVLLAPGQHTAGGLMVLDDGGRGTVRALSVEIYDESGDYLAHSSVLVAAGSPATAEAPREAS